jgi:glycopeptide antibiotics resistance protein
VVAFPFPVGIPNPHFRPSINLIPFNFGYCDPLVKSLCLRNLYENILLTIPFGFGVSFIIRIKPKNIFWLALTFGLALELIQFIISIVVQSPFRIVDINDVMLNAMGVLVGYGIFRLFGWLYSYITDRFDIQHKYIFAYIDTVVR